MVEEPIELKDISKKTEFTTRQDYLNDKNRKIGGSTKFSFRKFKTDKERLEEYNTIKREQDIFKEKMRRYAEQKEKEESRKLNTIQQPAMRFKPRTDLERIYYTVNEQSLGKISKKIVNDHLEQLSANNIKKISEDQNQKLESLLEKSKNIDTEGIEELQKQKEFMNNQGYDEKNSETVKQIEQILANYSKNKMKFVDSGSFEHNNTTKNNPKNQKDNSAAIKKLNKDMNLNNKTFFKGASVYSLNMNKGERESYGNDNNNFEANKISKNKNNINNTNNNVTNSSSKKSNNFSNSNFTGNNNLGNNNINNFSNNMKKLNPNDNYGQKNFNFKKINNNNNDFSDFNFFNKTSKDFRGFSFNKNHKNKPKINEDFIVKFNKEDEPNKTEEDFPQDEIYGINQINSNDKNKTYAGFFNQKNNSKNLSSQINSNISLNSNNDSNLNFTTNFFNPNKILNEIDDDADREKLNYLKQISSSSTLLVNKDKITGGNVEKKIFPNYFSGFLKLKKDEYKNNSNNHNSNNHIENNILTNNIFSCGEKKNKNKSLSDNIFVRASVLMEEEVRKCKKFK